MNNSELCIPAGALSEAGEMGGAMMPAVGDEVEVTVTGRVTRTENGETYIQPLTANGQPIEAGGSEMEPEGMEDAAIEEELRTGNLKGGSMPLMVALLFCFLAFTAGAADLEFAKARACSGTIVSNYVAVTGAKQVFSVEIDNYTGATLYLMVFDSATNQLANATPHITPIPIPTGTVWGKDWGAAGIPFEYGVNVCLSTTPRSLTNASSGGIVTVVHSPRK